VLLALTWQVRVRVWLVLVKAWQVRLIRHWRNKLRNNKQLQTPHVKTYLRKRVRKMLWVWGCKERNH
jgi:hypothetical protein